MSQIIEKDPVVMGILQKMWELNNKRARNQELTYAEKVLWNKYISLVKGYYQSMHEYWALQKCY